MARQPDLRGDSWQSWRDAQHPVLWSPANGEPPAYLTVKAAAARLAAYRTDSLDDIAALLLAGVVLRTPFAFYVVYASAEVRRGTPA